jgi:hypothetical protein
VAQGVGPEFKLQYCKKKKKWARKLGVVVYACNSSTQETEAGDSSIWGQLGLYNKTLSLKKKTLWPGTSGSRL